MIPIITTIAIIKIFTKTKQVYIYSMTIQS